MSKASSKKAQPDQFGDLIDIDKIEVGDRLRALQSEKICELMGSLDKQGQLHPIVTRAVEGGSEFTLVVGHHRLEAAKQLGWKQIRATAHAEMSDDAAVLAEIDENLIRAGLTDAEEELHLKRRKEIYEKLHPQTVHGAVGRGGKSDPNEHSFADDTAAKTGQAASTIRKKITRAERTDDGALADAAHTSLDSPGELEALSKKSKAEQRQLAKAAKAGENVSAKLPKPAAPVGWEWIATGDYHAVASPGKGKARYVIVGGSKLWLHYAPKGLNKNGTMIDTDGKALVGELSTSIDELKARAVADWAVRNGGAPVTGSVERQIDDVKAAGAALAGVIDTGKPADDAASAAIRGEPSPADEPVDDLSRIVQEVMDRTLGSLAAKHPDKVAAIAANVRKRLPSVVRQLTMHARIDAFQMKFGKKRRPPNQDGAAQKLCIQLKDYKSKKFKRAEQLVEVGEHLREESIEMLDATLREHGQKWIALADDLAAPKPNKAKVLAAPKAVH